MMWVRLDQKHRLKNDGKGGPSEPEVALARRLYGQDGALFPRMVLSIYNHKWTRCADYHIQETIDAIFD